MVNGSVTPVKANCELLLLAEVMVTFAPVAIRLPVAVPSAPTATLPKLNDVGVTANWPTLVVPVPEASTTVELGSALLVKVKVALAAPLACGLKFTVNGALWPTSIVAGKDNPLNVKRELLLLAAVIITFAPVAVKFPVAVPELPTVTLPKLNVPGVTARVPTLVVPVPVASATAEAGLPLLVKVNVALAAPLACGVNFNVNVAVCPAIIVAGSDNPLSVKCELLLLTAVTVTFASVAVRLPVVVPVVPRVTLPKLKVVGVTSNCPCKGEALAVRGIANVAFDALEVSARLPLALPATVGLKIILKFALCPAANVKGRLSPLMLNPVPVTGACVMVTLDFPVFVTVSASDWLAPV
jgi:hypothetical protein